MRLPAVLREFVGGAATLTVELPPEPTVRGLLAALAATAPALERRIRDERGQVRRHVNVFVGECNIRDAAGLDTAIPAGAEISVIPAVSGG